MLLKLNGTDGSITSASAITNIGLRDPSNAFGGAQTEMTAISNNRALIVGESKQQSVTISFPDPNAPKHPF